VADLEAVRQHLGGERWVFLGGSGGGCIALLYALRAPQGLTGLIPQWISVSGRRVAANPQSRLSPLHPAYQQDLTAAPLRRHPTILQPFGATPGEWRQLPSEHWVLCQGGEPVLVMGAGDAERRKPSFEEFVSTFDVEARLSEIEFPTLVAAGARDPYFPLAECRRLHANIPRSELVVLEDTGHGIGAEEWDGPDARKYVAALRRFLAGLS
jgi:proline iminopeptidase